MRKTIAALIGTATAATMISGAGLAAASTAAGSPAKSGTEHLYLMTTQPSASRYSVIATGVFTAGGVDISGNVTDTIKFRGGTFKVHHGGPSHVVRQRLNRKTCLFEFEVISGFKVGGGTGAYKGISGSGKAVISALAIARRNSKGQCNPNANPVVNQQTITAKGHIKL
ncbi:MAG TPA: hypothetical protein VIJ82_08730 [Streptosporangiaceae bacterium]|jgi:hypothetical protein